MGRSTPQGGLHLWVWAWRTLVRAAGLVLVLSATAAGGGAQAAVAHMPSVLFVGTSPLLPGKFTRLAELAQGQGLRVQAVMAEKLARVDASLWAGHDMVVFDTPREHMHDYVRTRLADALPALAQSGKPVLWMLAEQPQFQGLDSALAQRLHAYYTNGGRANNTHMLATLAAALAQRPWAGIAPPQVFPAAGIYHPRAPQLVFDSARAYWAWRGAPGGAPVVALAFHQQAIAAEQTAVLDDLIARIESAGAQALAVYAPVMDNEALTRLLGPAAGVRADALINLQIMLNPDGRRTEFERLGLPVLQASVYRKGNAQAWAQDPAGISLMDVPFYLAQPEYTGAHDPLVLAAMDDAAGQPLPIAAQAQAAVNKALGLARLARTPRADKRVAIFYWNYPPGEKNLGASFMNLPRSLEAVLATLAREGYRTETPDAAQLTRDLQRLLRPYYRPDDMVPELLALEREGLAERVPLADYERWLAQLDGARRQAWVAAVGAPAQSRLLVRQGGEAFFLVPRLRLGQVSILPQPPRTEPVSGVAARDKELYHSSSAAPHHAYMASYLWVRQHWGADAVVHFGTHGTQEWLPGKERGLSVDDYPLLALGDVPVVYPYIVDDVGEAIQTKRRGRAVNISHQTPPFAPAGLHAVLTRLHDDLHAWLGQDEGAVKEQLRQSLVRTVQRERIALDMGWSLEQVQAQFPAFIEALHAHLHELALTAQPLGLHSFGVGAGAQGQLSTVLMMLGQPYWEAAAAHVQGNSEELDEALVADYQALQRTAPMQLLRQHLIEGASDEALSAPLRAWMQRARKLWGDLQAHGELAGLVRALDGRYIATSYGGDPIKNPDSLPTGRNLYGFDPSRVPTLAAWEAGKRALEQLVTAHRDKTGQTPTKLTFSLWSVETMRHFGLLEAQALWALGVEPVWDAGGRVVDVRLVERSALGRPRIDVVLSATGLYRDHFPNAMKQLARAVQLAAQAAHEDDNAVAQHSQRLVRQLRQQGWQEGAARRAAETRIFSGASGSYGSGLDAAALATDTWRSRDEADRKLADLYLGRMQYAFGPDERDWGKSGQELAREAGASAAAGALNLYAEQLRGTQAAVLARSSNLYGMLTTDDPFQYLGGIAAAVRRLDGKAPELFISNLRGSGAGRTETAAAFLAKELATRNFHPGYLQGQMREGYSGTLQLLDGLNNFTGWTTVAREVVRADQWQEFADVYVRDKHRLGLPQWMERENPHALAQMVERMLETARHGYWHADADTLALLKRRYRELAQRYDVRTDNRALQAYAGLSGFGLSQAARAAPAPHAQAGSPPAATPASAEPAVRGLRLQQVPVVVQSLGLMLGLALLLLALTPALGAWRQWRRGRRGVRVLAADDAFASGLGTQALQVPAGHSPEAAPA
ncbi:MAG: cobaltochelatase subunit CobN [Rhodoferax sp.]